MSLESFTAAYIEAALWSSTDESRDDGGDPLDANYGASDIAPECRAKMDADCKAFYDAHSITWRGQNLRVDIGLDDDCAGHDFWLNRNGYGAGFWDGDWAAPVASVLSAAAERFGEFHLCVGDDGQIWEG